MEEGIFTFKKKMTKNFFRSFIRNMIIRNNNLHSTNFKSGLTLKLIRDIRNINVAEAEADFAKFGIDANFKDSKTICANFVMASNILKDISEKYKLPFDFNPPAIRVYNNKELIDKEDKSSIGFCSVDTKRVLKDEPPFIGGSVFMNKKKNGLLTNDLINSDLGYMTNWRSSSHFLASTLHEWFHCIHQNLIFKQKGYEGNCPVLKGMYGKEGANGLSVIGVLSNLPDISAKAAESIGKYAVFSRSMLEVFAELMAKITAEALDKDLNVVKNPMDNIPKEFPNVYKKQIEEILKI